MVFHSSEILPSLYTPTPPTLLNPFIIGEMLCWEHWKLCHDWMNQVITKNIWWGGGLIPPFWGRAGHPISLISSLNFLYFSSPLKVTGGNLCGLPPFQLTEICQVKGNSSGQKLIYGKIIKEFPPFLIIVLKKSCKAISFSKDKMTHLPFIYLFM